VLVNNGYTHLYQRLQSGMDLRVHLDLCVAHFLGGVLLYHRFHRPTQGLQLRRVLHLRSIRLRPRAYRRSYAAV